MHGLHQSCTTGHILNEAGNAHTVLGGNPLNAVEVLLHIVADVRILQIGLRGHSGDDAATDVLGQAVNIINELGDIVLTHIGKQRVYKVGTGGGGLALGGAGQ